MCQLCKLLHQNPHPVVLAESIDDRLYVGMNNAKQTYKVTTQKGIRSALLPLSRIYRADRHFTRPTLKGKWCTEWMFGRTKSLDGNVEAQAFANKEYFCTSYPTISKKFFRRPWRHFAQSTVHQRNSPLLVEKSIKWCTDFMKTVGEYDMLTHVLEPDRHN